MFRPLTIATVASLVLILIAAVAPAAAKPPVGTCAMGFMSPAMTLEEAVAYKTAAGFPPEGIDYFTGYFERTDKNGNGRVCVKDLPDTPGIAPYVTQLADDNTRA